MCDCVCLCVPVRYCVSFLCVPVSMPVHQVEGTLALHGATRAKHIEAVRWLGAGHAAAAAAAVAQYYASTMKRTIISGHCKNLWLWSLCGVL